MIQDYPQQQMPGGGKEQESNIANYVIHNCLSQHSIVIMNALKMLTYANLKKKKNHKIKYGKTHSKKHNSADSVG